LITVGGIRDHIRPLLENQVSVIVPGPDDPDVPGSYIKITRTGGPGTEMEDLLDIIEIQFECVGEQFDYDSAERIALEVDVLLQRLTMTYVGGARVISVWRVGSAPAPLLVDDAQRHHFACSYLWRVQSGL